MNKIKLCAVMVCYNNFDNITKLLDLEISNVSLYKCIVINRDIVLPLNYTSAIHNRYAILHNGNIGKLAGAYNKALEFIMANWADTEFVLFIDDDTPLINISSYVNSILLHKLFLKPNVASLSGAYVDLNTNLRACYYKPTTYIPSSWPRNLTNSFKVGFNINSLSIWRLKAIIDVGLFDEILGLDHIDTDYCIRARLRGWQLFIIGNVLFLHQIGNRIRGVFFFFIFQTTNHSALRRKSIGFGSGVLLRKYFFIMPSVPILMLLRLIYESAGIILLENNRKFSKLYYLINGFFRGILNVKL